MSSNLSFDLASYGLPAGAVANTCTASVQILKNDGTTASCRAIQQPSDCDAHGVVVGFRAAATGVPPNPNRFALSDESMMCCS